MDSIFGIVGKDFVLLAADCKVARSILVYKDDEDKVRFRLQFSRLHSFHPISFLPLFILTFLTC